LHVRVGPCVVVSLINGVKNNLEKKKKQKLETTHAYSDEYSHMLA